MAPRSLQPALREAKRVTTWEGDLTTQGALASFLAEGHHAAHVRRALRVYRGRREALLAGLAGLDDRARPWSPRWPGSTSALRFRDPAVDDRAVVGRAAARGVRVEPLSQYRLEQPVRPGLVLGYGGIEPDAVPDALARLEAAVRG